MPHLDEENKRIILKDFKKRKPWVERGSEWGRVNIERSTYLIYKYDTVLYTVVGFSLTDRKIHPKE